jgi:hypothetical protein
MNPKLKDWKAVNSPFNRDVGNALQQQHLAAQFIALVGRYLVPKKPDSSNISMQYIAQKDMLVGSPLENGIYLGLKLSGLEIYLQDEAGGQLRSIQLNGKTFEIVFAELRLILSEAGVDVSKLKNEQPYSLPNDSLRDGQFFHANNYALQKATVLRHNAEIVMAELEAEISDAVPVLIWPHHFDTGTFFATARNQSGEISQTIGMGWAIPDEMIKEPYFYLSYWSEEELDKHFVFPPFKFGKWMTPDWKGAVLPHSEIIKETSALKQGQLVKQFFNEGVSVLTHLLKQ